MLETLSNLGMGLFNCMQPVNLLLIVFGLVVGLLVGVLPGLTVVMGVTLALPFTYAMDVTPAIVLLTAMYVTGTYGGAFTSILFRIPGEPIHVPLLWDGYVMARQGHAAKALGWALCGALVGGIFSAIVMVSLSEIVAKFALGFSTPEYFAVVLFGLASVVALSGASLTNGFISLFLGLLLATVGMDAAYGIARFTFGSMILMNGIEFLTIMVGAYGVGEVLTRLGEGFATVPVESVGAMKTRMPPFKEILSIPVTFLRSSIVGTIIGIIPGAGATIASFVTYGVEAQYGKRKEKMGTGIAEGIVAPQAAATASVGGALIPLLTLGLPGSGSTAVILGAFLLHGIQPGPQIFLTSADMVYTVFASLFLSILLMCVIGYFAIRPLVKILDFPEAVVSAFIMLLCFIGALSIRNSLSDLWLMVAFGIIGWVFEKIKFPIAPMVLGSILGPMAENSFMTTMISFQNDWTIFLRRPISAVVILFAAIALFLPIIQKKFRSSRRVKQPA